MIGRCNPSRLTAAHRLPCSTPEPVCAAPPVPKKPRPRPLTGAEHRVFGDRLVASLAKGPGGAQVPRPTLQEREKAS